MPRKSLLISAVLAALLTAGSAGAHDGRPHDSEVSGPADDYVFAIPAPGSYSLPPIKPAAGGSVLDENGQVRDLADLVTGPVTVLGFIYTRCAEACPVATMRLMQLYDMAGEDPALASRLRLISMSFDARHDTPEVMRERARSWRGPAGKQPEWLFLTAPDAASLGPVLAAYDQTVNRKPDPDDPSGPLSHILRVFLIDGGGAIRNIYSLDFLDPRLVLNDIRTLLMERGSGS